jgi:hypothetical protein
VTDLGRIGGRGEKQGKEWMRRGRKSSLVGEQWIVPQEKEGKLKGGKNRDKKIVMVKLKTQKKNNHKKHNRKHQV